MIPSTTTRKRRSRRRRKEYPLAMNALPPRYQRKNRNNDEDESKNVDMVPNYLKIVDTHHPTKISSILETQFTSITRSIAASYSSKFKFVMMKSFNEENFYASLKYGLWTSPFRVGVELNEFYHSHDRVFLILSICGSKHLSGVMEMTSEMTFNCHFKGWKNPALKYQGFFHVRWILTLDFPLQSVQDLVFFDPKNQNMIRFPRLRNGDAVPVDVAHVILRRILALAQSATTHHSFTTILQDRDHYEALLVHPRMDQASLDVLEQYSDEQQTFVPLPLSMEHHFG